MKSIRYRGGLYKAWLAAFVVAFLILGYLGVVPVTVWGQFREGFPFYGGADKATVVARVLTVVYFLFFLLMPWYTARDKTKPVPARVTWIMTTSSSALLLVAARRGASAIALARRRRHRAWRPRRSIASTRSRCSAARATSSTTASLPHGEVHALQQAHRSRPDARRRSRTT